MDRLGLGEKKKGKWLNISVCVLVYVSVYVCVDPCMCVCVCVCSDESACVCVCVCECVNSVCSNLCVAGLGGRLSLFVTLQLLATPRSIFWVKSPRMHAAEEHI